MPVEKSAGAAIFRRENSEIYYLLLRYPSGSINKKNYWDLPKGHIEKGEKIEDTVKREVMEETGLTDIKIAEGFKETIKYYFKSGKENIFKTVVFLLAETEIKKIRISPEHVENKWLNYEEAIKQATFKNAKEIIKKASKVILGENF